MMIFDNKNVTILNKSGGFSVQGGKYPEKNLYSLMAARYTKELIHITHRLDKPTTGIVILAKNVKTAKLVQMAIEERSNF